MSRTDQAIDHLADQLCVISKRQEHKPTFVKTLRALVEMAKAEVVTEMQLDFERCQQITIRSRKP